MSKIIKVINLREAKKVVTAVAIPLIGGLLVGYLSMAYSKVDYLKPGFTPPGWVFSVVWTLLYILMGVASYRIWRMKRYNSQAAYALWLYAIQLVINFIWPFVFFKQGNYGSAFFLLLVLWVLVAFTSINFYKIDKKAGLLMLPYLIWLTFAGILNYFIWIMNV
ncbi:TspO [Fervidicella metallireducens AeB]|uniref:TspO n=1 Tax=Fervidicella metallireducens AeB TaxID=1403537 RepID=A0A017RVU8_9CLOT|nr:TspO/MBR family protein [Fervidicella metallireducens]EYE88736.1 TspO [Fervidicella metallireducens AeB]